MNFQINIPIIPNDLSKGVSKAIEDEKKQNSKVVLKNESITNDSPPPANDFPAQKVMQETLSDKQSPFTGAYYHDRLVLSYGNTVYEFPGDPFVKPVLNKRIVETEVVNGNIVVDTVTEIIGDGRYMLTIEGELKGLNGEYPQEDLQRLARICKLGYSWKVTSRFLGDLAITNLVIHSFQPDQPPGEPDTIYFTIQAKEDRPAELLTGALGFT
jgi:hypothetical protein